MNPNSITIDDLTTRIKLARHPGNRPGHDKVIETEIKNEMLPVVLQMKTMGFSETQIAKELNITAVTVRNFHKIAREKASRVASEKQLTDWLEDVVGENKLAMQECWRRLGAIEDDARGPAVPQLIANVIKASELIARSRGVLTVAKNQDALAADHQLKMLQDVLKAPIKVETPAEPPVPKEFLPDVKDEDAS